MLALEAIFVDDVSTPENQAETARKAAEWEKERDDMPGVSEATTFMLGRVDWKS